MKRANLFLFLFCLFLAVPSQARIITVDDDKPADFDNIQAAINDANDGDTIIVADGTYTGQGNRDIDFLGKAIMLRSENGPENCIIDCNGTEAKPHRGFYFHNGEDSNSVLDGFTIRNGYASGGGIRCDAVSPTIRNCIITKNRAGNHGGGILCIYCQGATFDNCIITENSAHCGGGIDTSYGQVNPVPRDIIVTNCTFSANSAEWLGGAISIGEGSRPSMVNCILWGDTAPYGPEIAMNRTSWPAFLYISFSNIQGGEAAVFDRSILHWEPGNIDADPCFAQLAYWDPNGTPEDANDDFWVDGDYHLKSKAGRWDPNSQTWVQDDVTSPCINAGNPGCPEANEPVPNGNRRNMGAYGGTAEASKSPVNWRNIADLTNDWVVDSNDLKVFVGYWLQMGRCIPSDLNRSQFVDFADYGIFALQWSYPSASEPSMTFQIDDCNMEEGQSWPVAAESNEPRFSVWVEGRYIHFEDLMYANCCPDELGLDKEINGNQITLYEIGYGGLCDCMCYFPIKATLGPFEDGTYTVEVYDNYGQSLGVVEVTIGETTGPGIEYQIFPCNRELFTAEQPGQTRFTVTVEGRYIHFKDMMRANCCPDELGLEMTVEDNLITIYETEYTPGGCHCNCDFPVTATLGPFEPGIYTLEVYESGHFIGSTTVVIAPPE